MAGWGSHTTLDIRGRAPATSTHLSSGGFPINSLCYREYYEDLIGKKNPHKLKMNNIQTKKSSDLIYDAYKFNLGLTDSDFVKGRLTGLR